MMQNKIIRLQIIFKFWGNRGFCQKNNGETEDFGQKNLGVSEVILSTFSPSRKVLRGYNCHRSQRAEGRILQYRICRPCLLDKNNCRRRCIFYHVCL